MRRLRSRQRRRSIARRVTQSIRFSKRSPRRRTEIQNGKVKVVRRESLMSRQRRRRRTTRRRRRATSARGRRRSPAPRRARMKRRLFELVHIQI